MSNSAETLRHAARNGRLVTVRCRSCAHEANFLAGDLAGFASADRPLGSVRFRCRGCNGTQADVSTADLDRDRLPDVVVWRPTRLR